MEGLCKRGIVILAHPHHHQTSMTRQQFIAKWGAPGSVEGYLFEEKSSVIGGKTGYADVSMRSVFAWENKAPVKNLDSALEQAFSNEV